MADHFQNNEMEYGTGNLQKTLLEVLLKIDAFCKENDIQYSLSGGSLLGAVRHKGFIPWDDDIDIMFDRKNYDKFLSLSDQLDQDLVVSQNIWVKRVTRRDNPDMDMEIGCIDLFVFDNVPDCNFAAKAKVFLILILQGIMKPKSSYENYSFKDRILLFSTHILGLPFSKNAKFKMYDDVSRMANRKQTKHINVYNTFFHQVKELRFPGEVLRGYTMLEFEGYQIMAIQGYDEYLRILYGDYMKESSKEKRKPAHLSLKENHRFQ